jgi:hypothetical protein
MLHRALLPKTIHFIETLSLSACDVTTVTW